jgi:hypothetical protein
MAGLEEYLERRDVPLEMRINTLRGQAGLLDDYFVSLGEELIKCAGPEEKLRCKEKIRELERYINFRRKRTQKSNN